MEQEVLQVKKAGDFHYNIFFEKSILLTIIHQKSDRILLC